MRVANVLPYSQFSVKLRNAIGLGFERLKKKKLTLEKKKDDRGSKERITPHRRP